MKRFKTWFPCLASFIFFLAIAIACATPKSTYQYKPLPCVKHKALTYSPVLLRFNISGSYTMKNLSGAQRSGSEYLMDAFENINPYKYKLADGVSPNMTLNVTFNIDSYQHYGATLYGTVYDGDFNSTFPTNYVTPEKILDDIASRVDGWVRYGWCNNCPSPCDPNN